MKYKWTSSKTLDSLKDEHGRLPAVLHSQELGIKLETKQVAQGAVDNTPYECTYGEDDEDPYLVVTLLKSASCEFMIMKKGPEHGASKWWHRFSGRVAVGDEHFDAENMLTVLSMKGEVLKRFSQAEFLNTVTELREIGFTGVRKDALGIDAFWLDYPHGSHVPERILEQALCCLQRLVDAFPDAPHEHPPAQTNHLMHWQALIAMPVALALGAITLTKTGNYNPVGSGMPRLLLMAIVPATVLTVLLLFAQRRLTRTLPPSRVKLWIWRIASIGMCLLSGSVFTMWLNGALDGSDQRKHIQRVIAVGEELCYADVEFWHAENRTVRVPTSCDDCAVLRDTFREVGVYPPLQIVTKSGFLGAEWFVSHGIAGDSDTSP